MTEPRKASDILLELEAKVDALSALVQTQELNIRLLSNKLTMLMDKMDRQPVAPPPAPFKAEPVIAPIPAAFVQPPVENKNQLISPEHQLPMTDQPVGFRRTSRPETYAGDEAYRPKAPSPTETVKFPVQTPHKPRQDMVPPAVSVPSKAVQLEAPPAQSPPAMAPSQRINAVPVQQRIVDKNSKAVFLAEVEVVDHQTSESVFKGRTNGAGKWSATLAPGNYRVSIKKVESLTKQRVEMTQDISVDGNRSPLELPMAIMK